MAGNGDPAEISQVLCLKRIIIVVGWDRYVEMSLTLLSLLLWLMLPWLSTFNYFSFYPRRLGFGKILLVISSSHEGPVSLQPFFVSSRNSCIGALRDDTMNGWLGI